MTFHRLVLDFVIDALAWLLRHGLLRTVEVVRAHRIPRDRPVIIVANHFNGLVDAMLLAVITRGVPRFVAKATLWDRPLLRPVLWLAGLVPVSRREDTEGKVDNTAAFATANDLLRRRATLAIFPEGTTHDRLELAKVRTGAARIALGAHAAGIRGVTIVPIGLTYDDKLALRSRVLARVGDIIDVDEWVAHVHGTASPEDRGAVRTLTDVIRSRLTDVTPRYADVLERAILNRAAEVRLRNDLDDPGVLIPLARREALAQRLADAPDRVTDAVIAALGAYHLRTDLVRLRDDQLVPPLQRRWLLRRALGLTVYLAVLGVVMLAGIAVNLLPALITAAAGRRAHAAVTKGTVRVLTALVVFPLTWIAVAVALPLTGIAPTLLALVAAPISGAVAVGGLERAIALTRAWTGWLGLRNARDLLPALHEARRRVCEAIDFATSSGGATAATGAADDTATAPTAASPDGDRDLTSRRGARPGRTRRSDRRQAGSPPT